MLKYFLHCFVLFFAANIYAQTLKPTKTEALLNLTLTDFSNNFLKTEGSAVGRKDGKLYIFKTDAAGKAQILVPAGDTYTIKITNSLLEYDQEVWDEPDFTLPLTLKFEISKPKKANNVSVILLHCFNRPSKIKIGVKNIQGKLLFEADSDTLYQRQLPMNEQFSFIINGVNIENAKFQTNRLVKRYFLHFKDNKNAILYPCDSMAGIWVTYKNLEGELIENEKIHIKNLKTGQSFHTITNKSGTNLVLVPKNTTYTAETPNVKMSQKILFDNSNDMQVYNLTVIHPSTNELILRDKESKQRIRVRDSLFKINEKLREAAFADFKRDSEDSAEDRFSFMPINAEKLPEALGQILQKDSAAYMKSPEAYFIKHQNTVGAALSRIGKTVKKRIIVTDVTGSMSPFSKELLLWHKLNLMQNEDDVFLFFNDGDNQSDSEKIIGRTGGIYHSTKKNIDTVLAKMRLAITKGSGGDIAENDIEALIAAQKLGNNDRSLILIADNYAPVKDIELLIALKRPVYIILCGAVQVPIHPDYLRIAYETKGSVHTILEDAFNLAKIVEGGVITIAGRSYKLTNGRFFEIKKI
jgi:hypothetical protein